MRTQSAFRRAALLVALTAVVTSCDSQDPNDTTSLSVRLKDAPGDVQHAFVTITEVDLVGSGGVQVLTSTPVTTDLLTLATDALTLVQDVEVPSGTYHELRFSRRQDGHTEIDVLRKRGPLHVVRQPPPESLEAGLRDRFMAILSA